MRLKTYVVNNISEAMPIIKKDLGTEALILNTKKVKRGGFLGFFQKEKMEVIAAVESKPVRKHPKKEVSFPPLKAMELKETLAKGEEGPSTTSSLYGDANSNVELIHELKHLKQFIMRVMEDDRLPEPLAGMNQQFLKQEISPQVRSELISSLMIKVEKSGEFTAAQIKKAAKEEIIKLINEYVKKVVTNQKDPKVICFIGPTGVGKTTTIAKIAADYMLTKDKQVGLITSDTYRIAAVEQLKTYGSILNIPVRVVDTFKELTGAMEELKNCDVILMDTAGRNYQQKQYINELEQLLSNKDEIEINLVLSLTSKYEDMKLIIDNFQSIKMEQLILTKKDETSSVGNILNLLHDYGIPLKYITTGQNVPDDIVTVTPQLIADYILGEDDYA
ncbi:MAG: flagellar biosynthesis protein FlhF [Bacillus sp. (in: Bacteria)]|nr:flagellar biosynthesis protein FlhF [Bacillus sp. (in: firmicutes)]